MDDYLSATVFNDAVSPCALVTCKTRNNDNREKNKTITDGNKYELWSSKDVYTVYLWSCVFIVDLLKHMNCMCAWTTVYVQITTVLMWSRWSVVAASAGLTHWHTARLARAAPGHELESGPDSMARTPSFNLLLVLAPHASQHLPTLRPSAVSDPDSCWTYTGFCNVLINSVQMIKSLDEP